jgi:hypothetical protein
MVNSNKSFDTVFKVEALIKESIITEYRLGDRGEGGFERAGGRSREDRYNGWEK